ncbi:unnamed protein product [Cyprideis torosa]|uniref:Uncharacterized protein n=1 Tax=Cyprideis torosa TaxID=163714 RepID=A0A7R8ZPM8_9CRUS|nr:unnamed protein product [Cyprideis torosa]CAG0890209.1 unnamed protein product [Cyprideis torosa]
MSRNSGGYNEWVEMDDADGTPNGGGRFQVDPVDQDDTDHLGVDLQGGSHTYDTRYLKSLRRMTMEAFPREHYYRNQASIEGAYVRPTLDDLHGQTIKEMPNRYDQVEGDEEGQPRKGVIKFGWLEGVFMRCLLNIWGVMLFLRMTWVIGQAGIGLGLVVITLANIVTLITAISMSAVSTNGQIKGGGIYYMISRSLGPEFGGAIGLMFTISNSIACAMYVVGFCDSLNDLLTFEFDGAEITGLGQENDKRIIGCAVLAFLLFLAWVGMDWVTRTQMGLLFILIAAQIDFVVGIFIGPVDNEEKAKGFIGLSTELFKDNFGPAYTKYDDVQQDFFSVFAVFFPAVTGIVAGANLSGDLKDPASAIPKGTLLAIGFTYLTYIGYGLLSGACIVKAATGNLTQFEEYLNTCGNNCSELDNPALNCEGNDCEWGLQWSQQALELASAWGPLIYGGCFAATLSSAIASLVGAPRVFQALAKDKLYPGIGFFSVGSGANNDPIRGYFLCFAVAIGCVLIGDLNAIGSLTSNFFLAAYALINFSVFHASFTRSPGWRPAFKYYNAWVSLVGTILCLVVMFTVDWIVAFITFAITLALYMYVSYRRPEANWGSSTQAQAYVSALKSINELNRVDDHVKNYRPQLLGTLKQRDRLAIYRKANSWIRRHKIKAFYNLVEADQFDSGAKSLIELAGLGKLKPNLLMMGFKSDWQTSDRQKMIQYFNVIHEALDHYMAVAILRVPCGLDFSNVVREDEDVELKGSPSSGDMLAETSSPPGTPELALESGLKKKSKKRRQSFSDIYKGPGGAPLPKEVINNITMFNQKQRKGSIDVWWLFDDGGLTVLLPYILTQRPQWSDCQLRIFTLAASKGELEHEQRSIASLLSRFRIDFSDVVVISDVQKRAKDSTQAEFKAMVSPFMDVEGGTNEAELLANKDKSNRHMRLRELLQENSRGSSFVVITLPMPRKGAVSAPLYMAWLELLTRDMPPILVIRGNQEQVITFYS